MAAPARKASLAEPHGVELHGRNGCGVVRFGAASGRLDRTVGLGQGQGASLDLQQGEDE